MPIRFTGIRSLAFAAIWLLVISSGVTSWAQAVPDSLDRNYAEELPRVAPLEAEQAIKGFRVESGFHVELVAAEPEVVDPVAVDFDEDGRMYVVEMRGYSEDADELLGRIRLLEDADGDGRYEKSTPYVERLSWPTAVLCYDGGIFVGAAPDILYFKDTDADGRADLRRVVYTGFSRSNVQGLLNSFRWGLDNRVHGAASTAGGEIVPGDRPQATPIVLRRRDFAFDPRTWQFQPTSGGAQHGMCFDDWGRKFASSNSDHLQVVMCAERYLARNRWLAVTSPRESIAADGPQAEVFRISPVEPWRVVRTRLRVQGLVSGPVEGGGRAAGYFTGATGATIYRGDAWPAAFRGQAIIGDVGSNIVHRKQIENQGVGFVARRVTAEAEFISSPDNWFRPVQFVNAPDATLYILDMYREVIEHPKSLHPIIKQHLDLTSGRDRGRIYRIAPDGFRFTPPPRLRSASTRQLVALLEHGNAWHRETAARLLYERQDPAAAEPLRELAARSASPLGRMHAMYALDGMKQLTADVVLAALDDPHPRVREHAIRLAEHVAAGSPNISNRLMEMVADDDPRVRYQLAFTLGELHTPQRFAALAILARRDAGDRWFRIAIQSSLAVGAAEVFGELSSGDVAQDSNGSVKLLEQLARQIGAAGNPPEVAIVLDRVEHTTAGNRALVHSLLRGLLSGMARSGSGGLGRFDESTHSKISRLRDGLLSEARTVAADPARPVTARAEAIRGLRLGAYADSSALLATLIDSREPQEVQLAATETLGAFGRPEGAEIVLRAWPSLSPRVRRQAAEVLFARRETVVALLDAIEAGRVRRSELDPVRVRSMKFHRDMAIRRRAAKLFPDSSDVSRRKTVEAYQSVFGLEGDRTKGKAVFKKVCAACHKLDSVGYEIGPNLAAMPQRGPEAILLNVLDPNREVNPQYLSYILITTDGRSLTGMITAETAGSVTLTRAEGVFETVRRDTIEEIYSSGISLMPEGMEKEIDPQAMADLLAYLASIK